MAAYDAIMPQNRNTMSEIMYIASDAPLEKLENPHMKLLSINEALAIGADVPRDMIEQADDLDEPGMFLWSDIVVTFDEKTGRFSEEPEDCFDIWPSDVTDGVYTKKKYTACIEWGHCTPKRAAMVADYIARQLENAAELEIWKIWADGETRPRITSRTVKLCELSPSAIEELAEKDVYAYVLPGDIRAQYCLTVTR